MAAPVPEIIEEYRDHLWRRTEDRRVETAAELGSLTEDLGFCLGLTDIRKQLPSAYIAICGRRDAYMPRNVQKDPESSLTWRLKDEVFMRGGVYYGKVVKGNSMFIARRMVPYFNAVFGVAKKDEKDVLSSAARRVLKVLRKEWEMATADLRSATGIKEKKDLTKALDELQKRMKVVPQEVLYEPRFTYIWTLAEGRFPDEMAKRCSREAAVKELARCYLRICGMTQLGELARTFGISRKEAGLANHALVDEGFAKRFSRGVYCLSELEAADQK